MEYVYVGGKPNPIIDYHFPSVNIAGNLLISMIDVLNSSNSASKSFSFFKSLYQMHELYKQHGIKWNTFLDSGGYSIIVGDVKGSQTREFIERYCTRIIEGKLIYDYVFSLDIPIFLQEPTYNTKPIIKQFNRESLYQTYSLAAKDEILRNKLYFVWQFKIKEQYEIWNELYNELKLNDLVKNRAIGGMVGLRGITQIDFSPFIAPLYKCLFDYINGDTSIPFRCHTLGIYIQHDRFFLWFLEKLFNYYLNVDNCHLTYDSVNYMRTAQLKARDMEIFSFNGKTLDKYQHLNCPDSIYKLVYNDLYDNILMEIDNINNNRKMKDVGAFTPLAIYSNRQLDLFFNYVIDKYNILDSFLKGNLKSELVNLSVLYPTIFTSRRIDCIKMNFKKCWDFHQWWIKDRKIDSLNELMYKFINDIKFPSSLAETNQIADINILDHFQGLIN